MLSYLLKMLYSVVFWFLVMYVYYFGFNHLENFVWYTPYVISMIILYAFYKSLNYIWWKKLIIFTPAKIVWYFLLQLLLLSILFFILNDSSWWLWVGLFFQIIGFLFLPTLFTFWFLSFWRYLLNYIKWFWQETSTFQFVSSLSVGFFVFLTVVSIFWFFWLYNLFSVFWVFFVMVGISYKQFLEAIKWVFTYKIFIPDHHISQETSNIFSKINLYLLSSEFLFIVISFLISVNFINIVRPMPIGWDDLWVYMNFPNLMASQGDVLNLGWMYIWQVFTGIWYMISGATQAFFFNNVWGILSVIVVILTIWDFLKTGKKTFINIPFLCWAIFLSMPMIIFQLAKDMKLDPGLFFFSAVTIYMTFYIFLKYIGYKKEIYGEHFQITNEISENENTTQITYQKETKYGFTSYFTSFTHIGEDIFDKKNYLIYIFIIWILAGFSFLIKLTSLLLISGLIWVIFFAKLGVAGFLAYISFYIAIFTKAKLWAIMNVVVPSDISFINNVFIGGVFLGIIFLIYSINKYSFKRMKRFSLLLWLFLLWVVIGLAPWMVKNVVSVWNISISSLLGGKVDTFEIDYTKIYSQIELDQINAQTAQTSMTESGTSTNEDLWRYFWYEKWINNYLKLPYNLTMQTNQKGEYTDITYIFLALIPIILFLSYKSWVFALWAFIYLLIPLSLFFPFFNNYFTEFFSKFELPFWYAIIFAFFLIPSLYFIYTLNKEKFSQLFKLNIVFGMFYIFLWTISAFWIVWYGIAMYYILFLMLWIGIYYVSSYSEDEDFKSIFFKFFGSIVVIIIVSIYFFQSSFPHGFNNLKSASYITFKANRIDNYSAIFEAQPNYYDILLELNIKKEKQEEFWNIFLSKVKNEKFKKIIEENNGNNLNVFHQILKELSQMKNSNNDREMALIIEEAKSIKKELYKNVLYPTDDYKNTVWIYRIGTFLKYFISQNYNRLLEDSLVFEFEKYFFDKNNIDIWIERMKKMWVEYFLVDLNAATIDKDPEHNLTRRYEHLLQTFTSDKLELIHTDSICLKIWLEEYNASEKTQEDFQKYLTFAWVNYESYTEDWKTINRAEKQIQCYNRILELLQEDGNITEERYSYLIPIANYLKNNSVQSQEELITFFRNYVSHGWLILFRIK